MNPGFPLPSPGGYQLAYTQSYDLAFDALARFDLAEICRRADASRQSDDSIAIVFLGDEVVVDLTHRTVVSIKRTLAITDQLVILHYLVTASGKALSGGLISFKELPDGMVYYPSFYKRAIAPVVGKFGDAPTDLCPVAACFGGKPVAMGDAAAVIQALPRVTLTWVIWRGDTDFPAEGAVLFDSTIAAYLPVEDIAVLCQSVALRLCKGSSHGL